MSPKGTENSFKLNTVPTEFKVDKDEEEVKVPDGRNGVTGTTLAVISTIMGGGIVSVPYAYAVNGFWTGLGIQIGVITAIYISCQLYL